MLGITTGTLVCMKKVFTVYIYFHSRKEVRLELDSSWTVLFTTETVVYIGVKIQRYRKVLLYLSAYFARIFHIYYKPTSDLNRYPVIDSNFD